MLIRLKLSQNLWSATNINAYSLGVENKSINIYTCSVETTKKIVLFEKERSK